MAEGPYKRFPWDGHPEQPWFSSPVFTGRLLALEPGEAGPVLTVRVCVDPPYWIEVDPGMRHPGNSEYRDMRVIPEDSEGRRLQQGDWLLLDCQVPLRRSRGYEELVAQIARRELPVPARVWPCRPLDVWAGAVGVPYHNYRGWRAWECAREWDEFAGEEGEERNGEAVGPDRSVREIREPASRTLHWRRHVPDGIARPFWPKDLADRMPDCTRGDMARCIPGATCSEHPEATVLFESYEGSGITRVLARPVPIGPPGEYVLHDVRLEKRCPTNPMMWRTREPEEERCVLRFGPSVRLHLQEAWPYGPDLGFAGRPEEVDERLAVRGAPCLIPSHWPCEEQDEGMKNEVRFILATTLSRSLNQSSEPPPRFPSFPPIEGPVPTPESTVDCLGRVVAPMPELHPWVLENWSQMYNTVGALLENPTEVWRTRLIDRDGVPRVLDTYLALTTASPDLPVATACCEVRDGAVLFRRFLCSHLDRLDNDREDECIYRRQRPTEAHGAGEGKD